MVYVTGPDGQTISDQTATDTASPMPDPSSQPITVPTAYTGSEPLAAESLEFVSSYGVSSYVGVGFSLNPVAEVLGYYNGETDDVVSDYHVQINWGDSSSWDTSGSLVSLGSGYLLVKGSHVYEQQGTYDVVVYVTGPDGQTISDQTATDTASPMPDPSSQPITVPTAYTGSEPLAAESLEFVSSYGVSSYVGVGFSLNPVAEVLGYYNGETDDVVSDYHVQINWGDSSSWDTSGSLVSQGSGYLLVKGSHVYEQQGTYDVVVYVTGPDGQTISDQTATDTASPMPDPSSQPITVPTAYTGSEPLAAESLEFVSSYGVSSYVGVGFSLNPVAEVLGYYNGETDDVVSDYHVQINWGDSSSWDTSGSLVSQGSGYLLINGSHVYKQQGTYDIVVYVTAPDGQTISGQTATATVTLNPNAISLGDLSPSQWQQNKPDYDGTLSVTGGSGGYQNLQVSGLPPGLSATILSSTASGQQSGTITISGTPTQSGTFTLTTSLQDGDGDTGSGTESLTITPMSLTLGDLSPSQWPVNKPGYDGTISVTGGNDGYQNVLVSGLPSGLSATILSSTVNGQQSGTITISGTPTQSGTFALTTSVQDGDGDTGDGTESLMITATSLGLGSLTPNQWNVNEPGYDGVIPVSGGTGTYSDLSVIGLPSGLNARVSGNEIMISGTPTQSGTFDNISVSVQDTSGDKGSSQESLTIISALSLGGLSPTVWEEDEPGYDGTIAIQGGTGNYSDLSVAGLPVGLSASLNDMSGAPSPSGAILITGTPIESGVFTIQVSVQDGGSLATVIAAPVRNRRPSSRTLSRRVRRGSTS